MRLGRSGKKLEESFKGTKAMKGAKAYILKEKFASFKMKEDKSVPNMFHRMEVLVNDLKALGEKVEDNDFSHKFLKCLPARFGTLVTLLVRTGLDTMTPNQILGDIMTDDAYRDDDEKEKKNKDKKDENKSGIQSQFIIQGQGQARTSRCLMKLGRSWKNHLRAPRQSRVQRHTFSRRNLLASR